MLGRIESMPRLYKDLFVIFNYAFVTYKQRQT